MLSWAVFISDMTNYLWSGIVVLHTASVWDPWKQVLYFHPSYEAFRLTCCFEYSSKHSLKTNCQIFPDENQSPHVIPGTQKFWNWNIHVNHLIGVGKCKLLREAVQCPTLMGWLNKLKVVYLYMRILLSSWKEGNTDTCSNMDTFWGQKKKKGKVAFLRRITDLQAFMMVTSMLHTLCYNETDTLRDCQVRCPEVLMQ